MALTPCATPEKDSLERKPCADLSDTRVVQLDVRVIAEVGIRYTDVRPPKDHVVERIDGLETERQKHAFVEVDLSLDNQVEVGEGRKADIREIPWGIPESIDACLCKCLGIEAGHLAGGRIDDRLSDALTGDQSRAHRRAAAERRRQYRRCEGKRLTRTVLIGGAQLPTPKELA